MKYVYLIRSISDPGKTYVGCASDFDDRLKEHNAGESPHTARHRPWKPVVVVQFEDDKKAKSFEEYLKSGSGHAFANKHFW